MADGVSNVATASIAVGQTVVAYQWLLPKLSEVRQADPHDSRMRGDVLLGQLAAGSLSVGVGLIFGILTRSKVPVLVSVFTALIIGAVYHYAMSGEDLFE